MDSKFEMFVKNMNEKQLTSNEKTTDFEVLPTTVSDKIVGGARTVNQGCTINNGCGRVTPSTGGSNK